jgi:uncharacterized protein
MFYITHCYQEEEATFLQTFRGPSLAGARFPNLEGQSILRLRGMGIGPLSGSRKAELWLDPNTASWAVLEEAELALAPDLGRGISYAALLLSLGREREKGLRRLLGHLWQIGLLEVDGQSRWPADLFVRGPIFHASYLVEIHLTSRCNLACRYCFAQSGPGGMDMEEDLAQEAVDAALAISTDDLTIEFAGGEPLLRLPLLQRLIERIERASCGRPRPVLIAVQTNGLLLRKEAVEFFAEHPGVEVGISLDGPRRLNDFARVADDGQGRHTAIEAAARAAVSLWGKQAGALAVIHSESVSHPEEIAAYVASLGLGKMRLNPMVRLGRGCAEGASLAISAAQYLSFMQGVLDYLAETPTFEESNLEALVRNLILKSRDYRCMRSPCGAGYDYLVVTPTGDLYPCARFTHEPDLFLGNLNDGQGLEGRFMKSHLVGDMANRIVSRLPACKDCLWRHFCGGGCALAAHSVSKTLKAADPLCEFYRGIYPFLIQYLYQHPKMVGYFFKGGVACHVSPPPGISSIVTA